MALRRYLTVGFPSCEAVHSRVPGKEFLREILNGLPLPLGVFDVGGLQVTICANPTKDQMVDEMRRFRDQDLRQQASGVVCIEAHGAGRHIVGSDGGTVKESTLLGMLSMENCPGNYYTHIWMPVVKLARGW